MQSYYIKPKAFYDSFGDVQPSQPYIYAYGDRPTFEFSFLPNEIAEGDTLVFAIDNDMVFYDSTPANILHSASCMVVVRHDVTAEEATAGKVQMRIETRTGKFRDVVNGKVRPVDVISGLYRKRGSDDDINYVLLAKGRAMANGIIADYNALPEPITTDDYYTKGEIDDKLDLKANEDNLTAHTGDTNIHVTQQDKTAWNSKADRNDIGNATITITQGGETKGSFSVNATDSVTIDLTGGAQADWTETDTSSPSYIQHKPSVYTKTETDSLLDAKADKATTIAGYGITDAYTKDEVDAKVSSVYHYRGTVSAYAGLPASGQEVGDVWNIETADSTHGIKAGDNVAWTGSEWDVLSGTVDLTPYATKGELSAGLEGKSDIDHLHTGKYVPLEENNHIPGSYFVRGSLSNGGHLGTNGYVNALEGFKKNGVDLDDIYAAKSHTHAMGDITGLPASGGTAGQVLTKTETGSEWADAPSGGGGEDTTDYLCFTASQANSMVRLNRVGSPSTISLEYSVDKKTWTEYTWNGNTGATITLANMWDSVWWRGNNDRFSTSDSSYFIFFVNGKVCVSGNVMSLLKKSVKSDTIPTQYCFSHLFYKSNIEIDELKVLATNLTNYCYSYMFSESTISKLPLLNETTNYYSHNRMFSGCRLLIDVSNFVPTGYLYNYCYQYMFANCDNLKKATNLSLAKKYNDNCLYGMFQNCTSLKTAPALPSTLGYYWISNIFQNCSSLNSIRVCFTEWHETATYNWLSGVSSTGIFECPSALDCSTRDASHVPAKWTIVRTDAPKSITSPTTASSEATYQVSPNTPSVPVVTVASALTLNASTVDSDSVTYAEIVLDVASGATVTAGTNLTLVDTPTAGKRNICVCRWSGGMCKLYVTIVEDLPQA